VYLRRSRIAKTAEEKVFPAMFPMFPMSPMGASLVTVCTTIGVTKFSMSAKTDSDQPRPHCPGVSCGIVPSLSNDPVNVAVSMAG